MVGRRERKAPAEGSQQVRLRLEYRELLDDYTRDVVEMCGLARRAMLHASRSMVTQDLEAAESAMTESDKVIEIHRRCEDRALLLLALQNPVATDLRQVLSYIHMERDITRMGNLAKLVAKVARQHHPKPSFPTEILETITRMAEACDHMAGDAGRLIATPKVADAQALAVADEAVDTASRGLVSWATGPEWAFGNRAAVEIALVARYYERFADHCVGIGRHVVFMVTGLRPEETELAALDAAENPDIAELERRFSLRQ